MPYTRPTHISNKSNNNIELSRAGNEEQQTYNISVAVDAVDGDAVDHDLHHYHENKHWSYSTFEHTHMLKARASIFKTKSHIFLYDCK